MAEGTSAFMGRGVGLDGNYEIQGDNDTDDTLTITGYSSSAAGDVLVVQNSTGTEFLAVSASGLVTVAGSYGLTTNKLAVTSTGATAYSGQISTVLSSTLQTGALQISLTSTGAIAAGATTVNAIYVSPSSKALMNSALHYVSGAGSEVGTAETLLGVSGSKAPTLFLSVGSSAGFNSGVAINNGFASGLSSNMYLVSALATTFALGLLKCTMGSKVYYIPMLTDTMVAAS